LINFRLVLPIHRLPFNFPRFISRPYRYYIKLTRETIIRVYEYPFANDFAQRPIEGSPLTKRFRSTVVHGSAEAVIVGVLLSRWHRSNCQKDTKRLITLSGDPHNCQSPVCFFFSHFFLLSIL